MDFQYPRSQEDGAACPAAEAPASQEAIGLIAGNGRFPIIFAQNAKRLGYRVCAVAHVGETDPELEQHVDRLHWVRLGQLNRLIAAFKNDGIAQVVMLGGIRKTSVFSHVCPDLRALALATRLKAFKDDEILRAIAAELERDGIQVRESTFGLEGILVEEGVLTDRQPTAKEWEDIRFGWDMVRAIGQLDIGQCVVVKDRMVVAVEAIEGTDATIRRGGALCRSGAVILKRSKPQQDSRFDLPAVGPRTVDIMNEVNATVLGLEAGKTILLDRHDMFMKANAVGISVVGLV